MSVTTEVIARQLGINRSTVSRALQGKLVSKETIARVRQAAEQLGYRPNFGARIMASGRTGMIGLLVPSASNPYFGRVIDVVQARAFRDGYSVALGCYLEDIAEFANYMDLFVRDGRVDGVVVYPMHHPHMMEVLAAAADAKTPIVHMGQTQHERVHWVAMDMTNAWYQIARHITRLGHKNVALLLDILAREPGGAPINYSGKAIMQVHPGDIRYAGFLEGMQVSGLEARLELCTSSLQAAYETALRLLSVPGRPTAICAGNDIMAIGVLSAARELGLSIPADLSVTGFDNTDYAQHFDLTTVENLSLELLETPVDLLFEAMESRKNGDLRKLTRYFDPTLIVRGSTAPPPSGGSVRSAESWSITQ